MLQRNVRAIFRRSTLSEYVIRPLERKNSLVEIKLRPSSSGSKRGGNKEQDNNRLKWERIKTMLIENARS